MTQQAEFDSKARRSNAALLITGATGLVGGELLKLLLAHRPDRRVVVVSRTRDRIPAIGESNRVTVLEGDLTRHGLGLDSSALRQLQRDVTEIIHCGAETRFGLPLEDARATNTRGTANVLRLARDCLSLEKMAHLSTVYVAGRTLGSVPEAPLQHENGFTNTYQQSKYEAELLVSEAMGRIPAVIYRLSTIIGDSETGEVRQFNYFHQLLRLSPKKIMPVAPGDPASLLDVIPSRWSISALAFLFESCFVPGQVFNVCAGPDSSPTMGEIRDLTLEILDRHPLAQKWRPIEAPKLVTLPEYEKYVEKSRASGDKLLSELLRVLDHFLPQMGISQRFENRQVLRILEESGIKLPRFRDYYFKIVNYCLETNWGRGYQRSG